MCIAANITRAARSGTHIMQRVFHRADNIGMLAHAQIVVRAPHGDVLWTIMPGKASRAWIIPLIPKDIDEYAIAPFSVKPINRFFKDSVIIHGR
jgi:hypothetical protein